MPRWTPETVWKDRDVFIIGGGASLKGFNWLLLHSECTIGCNNAYTLGAEVCKVVLFGDVKWFEHHKQALAKYTGTVFTCSPQLLNSREFPWVWAMPREKRGLHTAALGWNGNTGASAINLALLLGAKRVFLLGFDMRLGNEGKPNWHDDLIDKPSPEVYERFLTNFRSVKEDLENKFPGKEIINVNAGSMLGLFPMVKPEEFWLERSKRDEKVLVDV